MIQILNFGEDKIVSMFYACGLHVLCIIPILIIHPIVESMMLVEAITVVLGGISISRRGFYAVTKLFFIYPTTNFYTMSAQNTFLRILTIVSTHPIDIMCHDSNFKFMNFNFF